MSGTPSRVAPSAEALDRPGPQLEQFDNHLIADTANIGPSQRMVTGKPATAGAAG